MTETTNLKAAEDAVLALIDENPSKALSFLAAHLAGLLVAYVEAEGGDSSKELTLEASGTSRDITLHAKKL